MGLFDWLLSKVSKNTSVPTIPGSGTYSIAIVGESRYQAALASICNGRSEEGYEKIVQAVLIYEDDNPYDDKAIRVEIQGQTVGYLSRENARLYRKRREAAGQKGITITCSAKIVGGWYRSPTDIGHFGVKLDLPIADHDADDPKEPSLASDFSFVIDHPNPEGLAQANMGDSVKFWAPKDSPTKIIVYRRGSVGGDGKLGQVPRTYAQIIANHLLRGLPIETEIVAVTASTCTIHCKLVQAEEIKRAKEKEQEILRAELAKPYSPRKPFEFGIDAKSYTLDIGEQLRLARIPSLDEWIEDTAGATLTFTNLEGSKTLQKRDEPGIKKKIIRLINTSGDPDIRVIAKTNEKHWYQSEYTLRLTPRPR